MTIFNVFRFMFSLEKLKKKKKKRSSLFISNNVIDYLILLIHIKIDDSKWRGKRSRNTLVK